MSIHLEWPPFASLCSCQTALLFCKGSFSCTSSGRSLFWNHSPGEWFSPLTSKAPPRARHFSMPGTFLFVPPPVFPLPPRILRMLEQNKATQTRRIYHEKKKDFSGVFLAVLATASHRHQRQPKTAASRLGVLTLRVNPEIAIFTTSPARWWPEGDNQDGREIVEAYPATSARTAKWWSRGWWRKSTRPATL